MGRWLDREVSTMEWTDIPSMLVCNAEAWVECHPWISRLVGFFLGFAFIQFVVALQPGFRHRPPDEEP